MADETRSAAIALRVRQLLRFRVYRFGSTFGVYLTHWFYFSNHSYAGERRYFVRIGQQRYWFGPVHRV